MNTDSSTVIDVVVADVDVVVVVAVVSVVVGVTEYLYFCCCF